MSVTEVCQQCATPASGEAFCPECFAPCNDAPVTVFTRPQPAPLALPRLLRTGQSLAPPDLRKIQYKTPSWFTRARMRSRGVVASLMVGVFFLVSAAYFYTRQHRGLVAEHQQKAKAAQSKGDYEAALAHYEASLKLHQEIFDQAGQVADLMSQARLFEAQGKFDEALLHLLRAGAIYATPDVAMGTTHIHRRIGLRSLAQAKASQADSLFEEALAQADRALDSLKKGEGTPAQLAAAHRVAALALARMGEDDQAGERLAAAKKLEGASLENRAVAAKLAKLAAQHKRDRELAFKANKAAEAAAMAKARRHRPAASAPTRWESSSSYARTDHYSQSYQAPVYIAPSQLPRPSYPTYQRPEPTYGSQGYPASGTSSQPSVSLPNPQISIPNPQVSIPASPPVYRPSYQR